MKICLTTIIREIEIKFQLLVRMWGNGNSCWRKHKLYPIMINTKNTVSIHQTQTAFLNINIDLQYHKTMKFKGKKSNKRYAKFIHRKIKF